ncbi:hypothetical protein [Paralcaligenes ureilyticus]|uniref:hypothetical protein n=1 Tax=Paralcaligenes ureilyticus TaxID=627131 RepID=UPI00104B93AC|nr:hypothetical protein [Paralcaligenes ureilyticus]
MPRRQRVTSTAPRTRALQGFTRGASRNLFVMPKRIFKNRADINKNYIYQSIMDGIQIKGVQKAEVKISSINKKASASIWSAFTKHGILQATQRFISIKMA